MLRNPVRATYEGWDDAANRQRLVDAVAPLAAGHAGVTWVVQLDADEVLAPGDADALRHAVLHDALDPTRGDLVNVLRVVVDEAGVEGYDQAHLWVGRMFAWHSGATLPTETLHLVALPVDLDPEDHVRTTLRILHRGSYDDARRRARIAKYAEADPGQPLAGRLHRAGRGGWLAQAHHGPPAQPACHAPHALAGGSR